MARGKRSESRAKKVFKYTNGDVVMPDPRDTDIVIPVMGPTGVGKSTFINAAVGRGAMDVGHGLESCTLQPQHEFLPPKAFEHRPNLKGRRVILLDTPGFDTTYSHDTEILRRIAVWLALSYNVGMKFAGIIYLHDISQRDILQSARQNFDTSRRLCGDDAAARVILTTTKWECVAYGEARERQNQLSQRFWNGTIAPQAQTCQFRGSQRSAWDIIDLVLENLEKEGSDAVQLQTEFIVLQKHLPETASGRTLRYALKESLDRQKARDEQIKKWNQPDADSQLKKEYEEIPSPRRIFSFIGFN